MKRSGNNLKRYPNKSLSTESRAYGFIQENINVDDGRGGFVKDWSNTSANKHSMGLFPMTAKQVLEYRSVNVEASHIIKMRAEIEVSELNRIVIDSRIFEILVIEDIQERGIVNWVFCKELRE